MPARHPLYPIAFCLSISANAAEAKPPADCDGLPRLAVKTAPGFCLGLAADKLKAPRGLVVLPDGDIIVTDMGSWEPGRGSVWRLKREGAGYQKTLMFTRLDRPNSAAIGPDGKVYIGMAGRVARFNPGEAAPVLTDVIGGASGTPGLPAKGRHLLPAIVFDAQGNLFVSVGSASDHCEGPDGTMPPGSTCAERVGPDALGVIRHYALRWPEGKVARWEIHARGLRNSMAMAIDHRTRTLWQGENARDGIHAAMPALKNDNELPHDELNAIRRGGDYGWPYCYDQGVASPEYPAASCKAYLPPARLLPAHAAPLGMVFYTGNRFPAAFQNSLLITYHGYRKHGHRVVALLDKGGAGPAGASVTLVTGSRRQVKGMGAPVGIGLGPDGDVYISDDHDGIVVKLHHEVQTPVSPHGVTPEPPPALQ
ncbi:sorbosone dehydrogenase family protein [Massilia sp. ST3]|uniref:PQQ-dependent sugar dehydrogenase n=1 Tax=Massilia sp. ST3 TaxID=2824903 RepID=UPI001B82EEA4|nr:PQQ-dependent sugar dehydrogenase [Massilia sp. ST3]MBQ5947764.1 PQQ-dependent sugar dehydrogenase [Massilia sp. ST3]